jgi:hypothetical protein
MSDEAKSDCCRGTGKVHVCHPVGSCYDAPCPMGCEPPPVVDVVNEAVHAVCIAEHTRLRSRCAQLEAQLAVAQGALERIYPRSLRDGTAYRCGTCGRGIPRDPHAEDCDIGIGCAALAALAALATTPATPPTAGGLDPATMEACASACEDASGMGDMYARRIRALLTATTVKEGL